MTVLMRTETLSKATDGEYRDSGIIIYNPAKVVAIFLVTKDVWRVQLSENRWFFVKDVDGKPDYGVHERGWLA